MTKKEALKIRPGAIVIIRKTGERLQVNAKRMSDDLKHVMFDCRSEADGRYAFVTHKQLR